MTGVFIRREDRGEGTLKVGQRLALHCHGRGLLGAAGSCRQQEGIIPFCLPKQRGLASTVISDFQPSELGRNEFLLF